MKAPPIIITLLFISLNLLTYTVSAFNACGSFLSSATNFSRPLPDTIFTSEALILIQLTPSTFQHISYLETRDFGKVACNGMLVCRDKQAYVFDTPADARAAEILINLINSRLKSNIRAVVPTHFHADCIGGINPFIQLNIPVYASTRTFQLLKQGDFPALSFLNTFSDSINLAIGEEEVLIKFFGEGHTSDNVIVYFPAEEVIFGGCLIKELGAGKGNLSDANVSQWPQTVQKVIAAFPSITWVIPGHGRPGGINLLTYTVRLFH